MYRLPKLPTLTIKNRKQYPQWHTYFERVYGHEVHEKINLNYFTFFYNFSPLGVWPQTDLPKENEAWSSNNHGNPGFFIRKIGFFVRRSSEIKVDSNVIEVIRTVFTSKDAREVAWGGESKAHWFYVVVGSGIFIDLSEKKLKVLEDRHQWPSRWKGDSDDNVHKSMEVLKLDAVLFSKSLLRCGIPHFPHLQFFTHPRPELIIKLKSADDKCCAEELVFTTGWKGNKTCIPNTSCRFINTGICPPEIIPKVSFNSVWEKPLRIAILLKNSASDFCKENPHILKIILIIALIWYIILCRPQFT